MQILLKTFDEIDSDNQVESYLFFIILLKYNIIIDNKGYFRI